MFEVESHGNVADDPPENDDAGDEQGRDDTSNRERATGEDVLDGIWASLTAPPVEASPGSSVESIKERLKHGAAQRRSDQADSR